MTAARAPAGPRARADGIVNEALALFDALAVTDPGGVLAGVRPALKGDTAG